MRSEDLEVQLERVMNEKEILEDTVKVLYDVSLQRVWAALKAGWVHSQNKLLLIATIRYSILTSLFFMSLQQ